MQKSTQALDTRADIAAKNLITVRQIDAAARAIADARYPDIAFGLLSGETQQTYRKWAMAALIAAAATNHTVRAEGKS